jgi:two-component system, NtrC family, sensor kinase
MAWLTEEQGASPGRVYHLRNKFVTLGRGTSNTIQLLDAEVSRRHAMIRLIQSCYVLDDLNSANGLSVNGRKRKRKTLEEGDRIGLGQTVLVFRLSRP